MAIYATVTESLLSYAARPEPNPLTAGYDSGAVLITCGAKSGTTAFCDKILVRVPVGSGPGDLSDTGPAAGIKPDVDDTQLPDGWEHSAKPVSGGKREFEFKNSRDDRTRFDGRNLVLILKDILINASTGNVTIEIDEYSAPTDTTTTKRTTTVEVRKAPEGFEFHSFRPMKVMVPNGEYAELTWVGSPAEYTMYWGLDGEAPTDPKTNPPWTSPEKLTNTTGYMLQAKVASPNGPMYFTQTCVVSVEKPDLEIGKLDVFGQAELHDGVTVRGPVSLFGRRRFKAEEVVAGVDEIARTDGFLVVQTPENTSAYVYTRTTNGFGLGPDSYRMIPVLAGEPIKFHQTSGSYNTVSVCWIAMGEENLDWEIPQR